MENKLNPKEKDITWRIHENRIENKSTSGHWLRLLHVKEEENGLVSSEDNVSEIYTNGQGI